MAFERPLEADRVDDLGFLSSFVRAPIVGPIMWMLGGDLARQKDEEERNLDLAEAGSTDFDRTQPASNGGEDSKVLSINRSCGEKQKIPKMNLRAPEVVPSDVSDGGDSSTDEETDVAVPDEAIGMYHPSESPKILMRTSRNFDLHRGRRKLSFSDEFPGRTLVEYMNESESTLHEPNNHGSSSSLSSSGQPIKSAMKKKSSLRSAPSGGRNASVHPSKCVPSGLLSGKGGGLVMPSGGGWGKPIPGNSAGGSNGKFSPQWGWYISTTPPTPDKYYAAVKGNKPGKNQNESAGDRLPPPVAEEYPMPVFKHSPTPVFDKGGVKDVLGHDTMGWPSIPL